MFGKPKDTRPMLPEAKKKDDKISSHNVLLVSTLQKEVRHLLRTLYGQSSKIKSEKTQFEPFSVSYRISINEVVEMKITTSDGRDSLLARQQHLKYFLTKVDNPVFIFLFAYNDMTSFLDIMVTIFKEIDQILKEDDFHTKLNYVLLASVDFKLSKKQVQLARRTVHDHDSIIRDHHCIEFNGKNFLNVKEIFRVISLSSEHKKKTLFPKFFKKKILMHYIPVSDKHFKDTVRSERSKAVLLRDDEDPTDSRLSRFNVEDPTENDLITSLTGLTDDSETPSDVPDIPRTSDSADIDTFSFNSELDK